MESHHASIDVAVDEKRQHTHVADSLELLVYVILLMLTLLTLWAFKIRRVRFLHESGLAIFYGLLVGMALHFIGLSTTSSLASSHVALADNNTHVPPDRLLLPVNLSLKNEFVVFTYVFQGEHTGGGDDSAVQDKISFSPELFFYVLLPPIIFHAGYSMRKKHFFNNFGAILAFALIGTLISTFVIAAAMYGFSQFISDIKFKFIDILYFGAIVSATDPVTILAIFHVSKATDTAHVEKRVYC
jgi:sodium/hydrogen exchanger-like protein 6/7